MLQWNRAGRRLIQLFLSYTLTVSSQYNDITQFLVLGKTGGKTEKQKSLCGEIISQNRVLFREEKSLRGGSYAPRGSAQD